MKVLIDGHPRLIPLAADGCGRSRLGGCARRLIGEFIARPIRLGRISVTISTLALLLASPVIAVAQTRDDSRGLSAAAGGNEDQADPPAEPTASEVADVAASDRAATVGAEGSSGPDVESSEVEYPYCLVEIEELKPRSLDDAVAAFNEQAKQSPIGRLQRPITVAETLQAIESFQRQPHLPAAVNEQLRAIAASGQLPASAYFRRFTRFDDGQRMHRVWWVRLVITTDDPPVYSVPVRTTELSSRSYTQLERQQLAGQGVMLLNRVSSYFADAPITIQPAEFAPQLEAGLTANLNAAIDGNVDALDRVFNWADVDEATRRFAIKELEHLRGATIESMEVRGRDFEGELLHWRAFQHYQPNLPIVGYVDIEYRLAEDAETPVSTLSLEFGRSNDELKLVNYVKDGPARLPNQLPQGLSITGQIEPLADGTFLMTSITSNPGALLSAHLANEETWKRNFNAKK